MPVLQPPAPPYVQDLLTGDSSTFDASLGAWVNTGGTLSRDTTSAWLATSSYTASLKFITTTSGQFTEIPIAGTFLAGHRYDALVWWLLSDTAAYVGSPNVSLSLGLQGTDIAGGSVGFAQGFNFVGTGAIYRAWLVSWVPSANRTGVTLRFARGGTGTDTVTIHVQLARVASLANLGDPGLAFTLDPKSVAGFPYPLLGGYTYTTLSTDNGQAIFSQSSDGAYFSSPQYGSSNFFLADSGNVVLNSQTATAGDQNSQGLVLYMGPDRVALWLAEKAAGVLQWYPGADSDVELVDGATKHWQTRGTVGTFDLQDCFGVRSASAALSGDVTMTTAGTFYDGPSVSLTAGTWLIWGVAQVQTPAGIATITAKIWDGSTGYWANQDDDSASGGGTDNLSVSVGPVLKVLGGTTTVKISVVSSQNTSVLKATAPYNGVTNLATGISAIRVA